MKGTTVLTAEKCFQLDSAGESRGYTRFHG
jgi:hypothetical protein